MKPVYEENHNPTSFRIIMAIYIARLNDQAGHCFAGLLIGCGASMTRALRRGSLERPSPKNAGEAGRTGQIDSWGADSISDASPSPGRQR